ncbi:hypothetical protein BscR1v2_014380 [Bartonella schoenbuchensis R1]|uniref:Uncharacterized protein n=1 Tax=Bartonella schoenbuchensis (strain DSM 13525 / NCTC 13165 / R1) TaxID=687861 RepID=A0A1S6XSJ6_BARSR|nr:hypothetical protein BscR1v2_014380 [Bartonella schoenbuchensis R1]
MYHPFKLATPHNTHSLLSHKHLSPPHITPLPKSVCSSPPFQTKAPAPSSRLSISPLTHPHALNLSHTAHLPALKHTPNPPSLDYHDHLSPLILIPQQYPQLVSSLQARTPYNTHNLLALIPPSPTSTPFPKSVCSSPPFQTNVPTIHSHTLLSPPHASASPHSHLARTPPARTQPIPHSTSSPPHAYPSYAYFPSCIYASLLKRAHTP